MFSFTLIVLQYAEYFRRTILKIEGDNVAAIDVAHEMNILLGNIMLRKDLKHLHPKTEAEMVLLSETDGYEKEEIEEVFARFFGTDRILFSNLFRVCLTNYVIFSRFFRRCK